MISTSPVSNNAEMGQIVSLLLDDQLINELIIGDIHSPMNKISDIFKLLKGNEIVSGWSIFHGHKHPIIVFPPNFSDGWNSIKAFVNALKYPELTVSFPKKNELSTNLKPWDGWLNYNWEYQCTDEAMKFTGELEILDISHLPKIRGIGYEEKEKLENFYTREKGNFHGIFHPFQILSDLYVVAENDDGEIIAAAGTHYETPLSVQLGNILVTERYRNQGLGQVITSAITLGVLRSHRVPTLFVNKSNQGAKRLYQKIGYEVYNEYEFYHGTLL